MTTTAVGDPFDDAERGLEWLEKLEALQARSASDRAAYEVAEYVMRLRAAVTALAGDRTASDLNEAVGPETAQAGGRAAAGRRQGLLEHEGPPRPAEVGHLTIPHSEARRRGNLSFRAQPRNLSGDATPCTHVLPRDVSTPLNMTREGPPAPLNMTTPFLLPDPSFLRRQEPRPVLGRPSHAPPRSTLTLALSPCRERGRALTTTPPACWPTPRPRRPRPRTQDVGSANGGGRS